MKDETKEILNKLLEYFKVSNINDFGYEKDKLISYEEAQILLDYITNLQEEVNKLTAESTEWESKYYEADNDRHKLFEQKEKAIEYINENKHLSMFADCREPEEDWNYDLEINPKDLLNILNGDDKK